MSEGKTPDRGKKTRHQRSLPNNPTIEGKVKNLTKKKKGRRCSKRKSIGGKKKREQNRERKSKEENKNSPKKPQMQQTSWKGSLGRKKGRRGKTPGDPCWVKLQKKKKRHEKLTKV